MAKKLTSVLGVDIGSRKIKVCEIRMQGREPLINAVAVVDTPEGAVDHQGIYNPDAVSAALKQAISAAGSGKTPMVVTISGQSSVLVRTLEVPKMNPDDLKAHMQWEISRSIPFAESTIVSDYKPLGGDDPASQNMDVVMAMAPQSAIDTMLEVAKKAGIGIAAIDVEPLSSARSLQTSYGDEIESRTVCYVEFGPSTSAINIYYGSKLIMPRQVPLGGDMITKAIADERVVPLSEAEMIKVNELTIPDDAAAKRSVVMNPFDVPGVPTQEFQPYNPFADDAAMEAAPISDAAPVAVSADERLFNSVAPILDDLIAEIRRSVDYFQSRGGSVDRVFLTGGSANIKGLEKFISDSLGIACDAYDPTRRLSVNSKKVASEAIQEYRHELAVAIGNGLYIFFD
jgi:type IV pilus assembly protein PilM